MFKFFWLTLRPVERFLTQCISVSTEPSAFVRERIRLGDTTNFLRAAGFFVSAISSAFLAEVATLYLLGIGDLAEPYYWLFILLTSIPFVLICFLLVRFVAPLSLKDVLHLSLYPLGTGVFTGAVFALVVSAVVGLLLAVGYLPNIRYDFTQWGETEQLIAVNKQVLYQCQKEQSLIYTIVVTGLQGAYTNLKWPIDEISWFRPVIAVLYLVIAARIFMAAVERRKAGVLSLVLLAAVVATAATYLSLAYYLDWNFKKSGCDENLVQAGLDRLADSALKDFAAYMNDSKDRNDYYDLSYRADGRVILWTYRFKKPINMDMGEFVNGLQRRALKMYCSEEKDDGFLRNLRAVWTQTFYGVDGKRLTSFSISPADCPQW